ANRKEILFMDAVDQIEAKDGRAAFSGILDRDLAPHVKCVVSTRPSRPWHDPIANVKSFNFEDLVEEQIDGRTLLKERGGRLSPPLDSDPFTFISQIVEPVPRPTMFALDNRLRQLESSGLDKEEEDLCTKLRQRADLWNVAPEELVRQELARVLIYAAERGIHPERTLFVLGVHVCAGRPLKQI